MAGTRPPIGLAARTDYAPNYQTNWRGEPPAPVVAKDIAAAAAEPFETLRRAHLDDLATLLGRVRVDWGHSDADTLALPTDARLAAYAGGAKDPDLEQTIFQYGRYLLASCSRPGGLPANLQGLWNDSNRPAWASDYHSNIKVQMNYWGAEPTALPECHEPLLDFVTACAEPCRIATRKAFGENTQNVERAGTSFPSLFDGTRAANMLQAASDTGFRCPEADRAGFVTGRHLSNS